MAALDMTLGLYASVSDWLRVSLGKKSHPEARASPQHPSHVVVDMCLVLMFTRRERPESAWHCRLVVSRSCPPHLLSSQ